MPAGLGPLLTEAAEPGELGSVMVSVRDAVRSWIGAGPVFLAPADPVSGVFTGTFTFDIPDDAAAAFFAIERGGGDVASFDALSRSATACGSLYSATNAKPEASRRWREVIEPLGWGDELRAVLRLDGSIWGYLCVHREAQERPFSARERSRAAALVPSMAAAMRRAAWATMRDGDPLPTGVLLVDPSGHVVGATGGAHAWLDELGPRPAGGLPLLLAGLARAVFDTGHPSTSTVTTRTGRLGGVEAALVHGGRDRTVAIVLSAVPTGHKLDRLAAACGLTNREREIVAAALTGLPTRAIADQLGISPHTVQAHLTSVFDKTNVRSRRALISRLST